jgi:hypothetical protein
MEQLTLTRLREICRIYNVHTKISKYSKLKKDELITEMKKHLVYGNNEILPINSMIKIPTKVIEKIIEENKNINIIKEEPKNINIIKEEPKNIYNFEKDIEEEKQLSEKHYKAYNKLSQFDYPSILESNQYKEFDENKKLAIEEINKQLHTNTKKTFLELQQGRKEHLSNLINNVSEDKKQLIKKLYNHNIKSAINKGTDFSSNWDLTDTTLDSWRKKIKDLDYKMEHKLNSKNPVVKDETNEQTQKIYDKYINIRNNLFKRLEKMKYILLLFPAIEDKRRNANFETEYDNIGHSVYLLSLETTFRNLNKHLENLNYWDKYLEKYEKIIE